MPLRSLHLIVDLGTPRELVEDALGAGLSAVQLRDKGASALALYQAARALLPAVRRAGAALLVNDRLDVALAAGADGLHLSRKSLPPPAARRVAGRLLVGASVHSAEEARAAAPHVDYLTFGHIFRTASKGGAPARGLDALRTVVCAVPRPVLAIGGVTAERVEAVTAAGAAGVVVISAIRGKDPSGPATAALRAALDRRRDPPLHPDPSLNLGGAWNADLRQR